jgi:photosystem II stability/assembly factor-like uncharacterized protein
MKKLLLLTLFLLFISFTNYSFAQWTQNGLEGGIVNSISMRSNGVLYSATYKGVYFSVNLGDNWQKGYNNLDQYSDTRSVTFGTTDVYAIAYTNSGQMLFCKSTDNGYNFNYVPNTSGLNANLILASNNIIYAGNRAGSQFFDGSVSYSSNGGSNWIQTSLSKTLAIYDLYISGSSLYASGDSGVYVTTNTGSSWTKLSSGLPGKITVYSLRVNGSNFYIGTDKGIYKSTNSGSTWTDITNGLPTYRPYYAIELKDNILFAAYYSRGVYKSTNNGVNWISCETGLKDLLINKFLVFGSYIYAASLGGGVYATADYGANWYPKNTGFQGQCVYSMLNNGTMLYAGTQGGGIYYSNNGTTWISMNSGLTNTIVYSLLNANSSLFAGTFGGIFKSTNNGNNWFAVNTGLLDSTVLCLTSNGTSVFAGTQGGGLFKSDNWGASWYKANNGINSDTIKSLAILNNTLFAGTYFKGIFRSTNGGQNWIASNNGFTSPPNPLTFTIKGNTIYTGNYGPGGFYSSTDLGLSWTQILSNPGGSNNVITSLVYNNAILVGIYATNGGKVLVTKNDGGSWTDVSTGTSGNPSWIFTDLRSFLNYNGTFLVGTFGKSIYSVPFNQIIGIKQISSAVSDEFKLYQNYPNPFNPSTIIKFQIKDLRFVSLKIFDMLGKEIATLVNEKKTPGVYEVNFDGSNLNSGVYFYQLNAGNFKETKKFLLIK